MKIAPRSYWNRLRLRLRGRTITLTRRVLAAGLLVVAAVIAARPTAAGPAPPAPAPVSAPSGAAITAGPGFATVPIRLADPGVAELLNRGTRVDVVATEGGEPSRKVLASMATVVDVRSSPPAAGNLFPAESSGPLVLISVPVEVAVQVAALSLRNPVTVTLR
ncbi:hypothetical protein [Amycolatopsis taiwanensis]|uniref:Flp pilus assembly protein RcpC/CpaB domain-containing protein n=1 Tax=Amycolatopsis taiwanensis TaxID=342230 RepID=A0A9W6QUY4_9PSEU|nr:hypothetical protein [Amycolatopsis taiwanensis]GLY64203.1 hypothetical protein Atai01_08220 [Amycolatopsis taiwanensis]